MVTAERVPMTAAERVVADELVEQLKLFFAGRSIVDAVALLTAINGALAEQHERATAEPTRH